MLRGTKTRLDIEKTSKLDLQRLMRIEARNCSRNTELQKSVFSSCNDYQRNCCGFVGLMFRRISFKSSCAKSRVKMRGFIRDRLLHQRSLALLVYIMNSTRLNHNFIDVSVFTDCYTNILLDKYAPAKSRFVTIRPAAPWYSYHIR